MLGETGKTQVPGFYKTKEGVVINKDNVALTAYKKQKERVRKVDELEEDLKNIKSDLDDIKELLKGLVR